MTVQHEPQRPTVDLILLPVEALEALLSGSLGPASTFAGVQLPPFFLEQIQLWQFRLDQARTDPAATPWLVRAVFGQPADAVVGHAGFHGPPDERGMVEIGYSILPNYRRRGYGRAAACQLLHIAAKSTDVSVVRASVSPGNVASLALVRSLRFKQVGEQWDDEDGLELVFERPSRQGVDLCSYQRS
ncbi:hypothetical protein BH24CHL4_BH24CHL4_08020 [soil metagenome]